MNILLVTHHFPPNFFGGGELRTYETARWLQQRGHRVRVLCVESATEGEPNTLSAQEDDFEGLAVRRLRFNAAALPDPFRATYWNELIAAEVAAILDADPPDLLHLIGGYLISASVLEVAHQRNIPTVVTLLEFWFLCPVNILLRGDGSLCDGPFDLVDCARCIMDSQRRYRMPDTLAPAASRAFWHFAADNPVVGARFGLPSRLAALADRRDTLREALLHTDAIISPSQFVIDVFERNGIPRHKMTLHGHVDNAPPLRDRWHKTPSDRLRIGYLGQFIKMKGVDVLVEAFQKVQARSVSPRLTLHGNLNAAPSFGRKLRQLAHGNANIVFAGTYDRAQVYDVLQSIDVLVFPSIWYENAPRVVRGAFETGTPVIATNLGSAAEYVQEGVNGMLFERGDTAGLTRALQRFVDAPELVARLRQNIPRVKPVAEEMEELESFYRSLLAREAAQ